MNNLEQLIADGKIEGFNEKPVCITTVISRVYIFENAGKVLKIYKRDNDWWNKEMNNLSTGTSRINFITQDFNFNRSLNPEVYLELKAMRAADNQAILTDPNPDDNELVIIMKKIDMSQTMTTILFKNNLPIKTFEQIGKGFAKNKLSLSKEFLPDITSNWYEQMVGRFADLAGWVRSATEFPEDLKEAGLAKLNSILESNKEKFSQIQHDQMFPLIDCNPENLLVTNGQVSYIDAYPPKAEWRIGTMDVDVFRVGSDIYALVGKEAYEYFLKGFYLEAESYLDKDLHEFYLLYGAMVTGPYFYMLSEKNSHYLEKAEKYNEFIKSLI